MRWVGPNKIIWGCDYAGFASQIGTAVLGMREFQIPEDMQQGYGFPPITDEDRRKIFGENLGGAARNQHEQATGQDVKGFPPERAPH